jgi:hypothetical protein
MTVGGKEFTFKKPVMRHLKYLASKKYEEWFQTAEMSDSVQSEEKFQEYAKKWKEFCVDVFVSVGEELEYENLTPNDVKEIVQGFFASLAGTPSAPAEAVKPSPDSGNKGK